MNHPSPTTSPLALRIPQRLCISGGIVSGTVELRFPQVLDEGVKEVHVKIRGHARTTIRHNDGESETTSKTEIELVHLNRPLWRYAEAYPPPGSHSLVLPFQFQLPEHLPPIFAYTQRRATGHIRYYVEAVGQCPGLFHRNKRDRCMLGVLPPDPSGAQIRASLRDGWVGPWKTRIARDSVHKFWGKSGHVDMQFVYPELPVLPINTDIPFSLTVETRSEIVRRSANKEIWPNPPLRPQEITFELQSRVKVRAGRRNHSSTQLVSCLGGMHGSSPNVHVDRLEKEWIPEKANSDKGRWKQRSAFTSHFRLGCPPTVEFENLSAQYHLHLKVKFGGLNNKLAMNIPIIVVSGILPPSEPLERSEAPWMIQILSAQT